MTPSQKRAHLLAYHWRDRWHFLANGDVIVVTRSGQAINFGRIA